MNEIGENFRDSRIASSISIEEASSDTNIPVEAIEQIEEGSIGSFKDIFKLREYLQTYARYLGIDPTQVLDTFNEYMFEYTSKITLSALEKEIAVQEKEKISEDTGEIKVVSPYLKPASETHSLKNNLKYIFIAVVIILLVAVTLIWAIKMVM